MIFSELNTLLEKSNYIKIKNPSYLVNENKVMVTLENNDLLKIDKLKQEFKEITGLVLIVELK